MPSVRVVLPTALLVLFPGCPRVTQASGATLREAIEALDARFPGMRDRLCDTRPAIRRHLNVFVGDTRAGLETPLAEGVEVVVLTAISGG
jgi:sulfur-carrier protein